MESTQQISHEVIFKMKRLTQKLNQSVDLHVVEEIDLGDAIGNHLHREVIAQSDPDEEEVVEVLQRSTFHLNFRQKNQYFHQSAHISTS